MAESFRCSIVTPAATMFDGEVTYAQTPAWDGSMGVMPSQSPMLTRLDIGALRLDIPGGGSEWFLIEGGFAQVGDDTLNIITDRCTKAADLDMAEAEAELKEANARITTSGADQAAVAHDQRRAMAKIALLRSAGR